MRSLKRGGRQRPRATFGRGSPWGSCPEDPPYVRLQDQEMDSASLYIDLLRLSVSEALRPAQSALVPAPSERPIRGARVTSWLRYGAQRLLSLRGYELARRIDIPSSFVTDGLYDSACAVFGRNDDRSEAP